MAKISTYPILSTPTVNDLLIGTDVENLNETKNFSIGDIGALIGQDYVPYVGATGNVNLGSFNITGGGFIVGGGTASQFLKADGSLDSTLYTPQTRTLTINGTTYNLSANRSWDLNTIDSLTTTGTSGAATYVGKVLNIPVYQAQGSYITQISGEATGSGPGNATVTLDNTAVISKILTGLNVTGGTVVSTDTILQAFGKVQNQINGLTTGVTYQGVWNAATNVPFLQSSVGTKGYYYVVDVAGNTNLNGITDWQVGDWAIYNGTTWDKVDNTDAVVSVNGYVGAVVLTASDVGAVPTTRTLTINGVGYNLSADRAWTVGDVRTDGSYANPSWITSLGWSKITGTPTTLAGYGITDGALNTTTLTINGTTYDLTANRSWSVGTVTSVGTSGPLTGGTITGSGTIGITQSSSTSDGYLSSADWNSFNSKQGAISVNAPLTFVSGVIGITQSGASTDGYLSSTDWNTFNSKVSGSGTANTLPMWGSASSLINSPLSYAADAFNFQYNSSTGGTINFTNIGLTTYTYSIQMNNFGSPRSTIHSYTDGLIIQSIGGAQVSRMFANGNLILGTGTVDNGYKLEVTGDLYVNTIANAATDTDRFIVSDGGLIKYRTGAQVLSDIGAQGALTLTTTGSSGPATLIGDTLNIPEYSSSLTGYVPYTGATQNVNLGEYGLTGGYFLLDTTPTGTPTSQGTIYWDDSKSTAALIMNGTIQHIGQDTYFYVKNSTGSSIPKGTAVRFAGTDGASGHLLIAPFLADGTYPSSYFMGVTSETIANGAFGQVSNFGELSGIDTSAYTAGALLYASTTVAGGFQTTPPVAPNNIVLVAAAINSKNNGDIIVRPQIGSNINNDEGVKIVSPVTGQLLQLQSNGLWENKTLAQVLGGTSSQFVKGDGSLDSNTYLTTSAAASTYVPYTGATGAVDLGTNAFSASQININGSAPTSGSFLGFKHATTVNTGANGYTSMYTFGTNIIGFKSINGANNIDFSFDMSAITPNVPGGRVYTLPDASGTLALTSNIPSGIITGSGTTNYVSKFTGSGTIGNSQIFDNGTNVGINQASPTRTLDILGASGIGTVLKLQGASGTTTYLQLAYNGATNAQSGYIGYNSSSQMQFFTNDTLAMTINSNQNVGIGTATPSSKLEIVGGDEMLYLRNSTTSSIAGRIGVRTDGAMQIYSFQSGVGYKPIMLGVDASTTSAGNILIGTTTDNGARLQVSGTAQISGTPPSTNGGLLNIRDSVTATNVTSFAGVFFNSSPGNDYSIGKLTENGSGFLQIRNANSGTELLRINSTGAATFSSSVTAGADVNLQSNESYVNLFSSYVVGLNSRARFRAVGAGGGSGYGGDFRLDTRATNNAWNTDVFVVNSSGNVGIGTSSPTWLLEVNKDTTSGSTGLYPAISVNNPNASGYGAYWFYQGTTFKAGIEYFNSTNTLSFYANSSTRMQITASGNLLVGTTTDNGARLQVSGTGTFSAASTDYALTLQNIQDDSQGLLIRSTDNDGGLYLIRAQSSNSSVSQTWVDRFTLAKNGAATFSSSVTANGLNALGSTLNNGNAIRLYRAGLVEMAYIGWTNENTNNSTWYFKSSNGNPIGFSANGSSQQLTIETTGNVLIGTTTDGGQRLQVSGTATISSSLTAGSLISASATFSNFGSETAAVVAFADGNTGFFRPALNTLGITTAGTERMRITSSGNVGIGTSSPGVPLHVISPLGTNAFAIGETGSNQRFVLGQESSYTGNYINSTNIDLKLITYRDGGTGGTMLFYTSTNTTPVERMRITSGGNVLIGTTTDAGYTLNVAGNAQIVRSGTSTALVAGLSGVTGSIIRFSYNGGFVGSISTDGSNTAYNTSSDYRLKQDIKDFNGLDLLSRIKPYDFEWKSDKTRSYGVLAHELQEVINYAVTGSKDAEEMQGVDYSKLVPILIKAIQEQQQQIQELKNA